MKHSKRVVLIVVLATLVAVTSACPKSSDLDRAAKASNELAHDLVLANKVVAEFYMAGKIPLTDKDKVAAKLKLLGLKGEALNSILIDLDKKYPQGTVPPQNAQFIKDNIAELRRLYTEIVADLLPFGAQKAVGSFGAHLSTIEEVAKQ